MILAIGTVVIVAMAAAPPSQLITVPIALVLTLASQIAAAKARRHIRLGDPNPTTWSDVFRS